MKKLLLPAFALFATGSFAQTYFSDDFNGSTLSDWTLYDQDGDGFDWDVNAATDWSGVTDLPFDGDFAVSRSWTSADGPLSPNNYMVSGAITIPGGASNAYLQWKTGTYQGAPYHEEEYTVYIATGSDLASATSGTSIFNEVLPIDQEVLSRSVDISAYIGSTIYLVFRHHNTTDMNMIAIDDVVVSTLPDYDVEMVSLDMAPVVGSGSVTISGTIQNNGANTITSVDIDWNDGTSHNQTFSVSIAPGATYNWTHGTTLNAVAGTTYDLDVCASVTSDADASNDCLSMSISAVDDVPTKYTVGWEKTGTWCGWCPRGAVALEDMESESQFIGIAAHNGDPMTVAHIDGAIGTYVPGGYPGAGVDNVETGDPTDFPSMHATRVAEIAPASIDVSAAISGSNIEVTVTADFVAALSGDYRLACVVVEDNVTGTGSGYNQANYYNGGGAGPLSGAGHDWTTAGNPVPAADMEYDHVARYMGGMSYIGSTGTLPATIAAGSTESYTYTIPVGTDWELGECHFVGMLIDGSTGEILNAGKSYGFASVEEIENNTFELSVYPNPANEQTSVAVSIAETSDVKVEIYNSVGTLVYVENTANLSAGKYYYNINVAEFASGMYIVKTTVNETVKTAKLSVQ